MAKNRFEFHWLHVLYKNSKICLFHWVYHKYIHTDSRLKAQLTPVPSYATICDELIRESLGLYNEWKKNPSVNANQILVCATITLPWIFIFECFISMIGFLPVVECFATFYTCVWFLCLMALHTSYVESNDLKLWSTHTHTHTHMIWQPSDALVIPTDISVKKEYLFYSAVLALPNGRH